MGDGYIVGAGAQGRIISEIWRAAEPEVALHFLDDDPRLHGRDIAGIRVEGDPAALADADPPAAAVLAIGHNPRRLELAAALADRARWATVVHPAATVMPSAEVGGGTVVFPQALVNTAARVGRHVVVNSGAIIEHDSVVEDGCSIGPGCSTGGRVVVRHGAFLSAGVTLAPRVEVGAGTVVGAGAVVVRDLPPGVLAYGVPARVVRPLPADFDFRILL